jgi:uncharacterized protein
MPPRTQHHALGLASDETLRQKIESLLPEYRFLWDLTLKGGIAAAADWRSSFLVANLEDTQTDWPNIVVALVSSPATRRIPIAGLGTNSVAPSLTVPMDLVKAEDLPDWVARNARRWDDDYYAGLSEGCEGELPAMAREGIALFNAQEFWEAHEALEHAWVETRPAPVSEVYRSILQVGVAYYQIQKGNYLGALKMFLRAVQWLDPLPDECHGIDLAQFKQDAAASRAALEALGPQGIAAFDTSLFKPVPLVQNQKG